LFALGIVMLLPWFRRPLLRGQASPLGTGALSVAVVLAGAAALLEFIPFAGPLAAAILAVVVAGFSGFDHVFWLIGFIAAYRLFQDYVLNPYLMSEGVEVSPLMVIVGLLAGDQLGGVVGIFLSVPVMAAIKIVFVRARAALQLRHDAMEKAELAAAEKRTREAEKAAALQDKPGGAALDL